MKKCFCILVAIGLVISALLTPSYAYEKNDAMKIGMYVYKVSQKKDYNRVSMLKAGKIKYDVVYDKFDNLIKVNGKVVGYAEKNYENTSAFLETSDYGSMLAVAKNYWNVGDFKHKYKVTLTKLAVIVAAVMALPAILAAAMAAQISMAAMKAAVKVLAGNIIKALKVANLIKNTVGKFYVSGDVKFTLQRRGDCASRYANRKLYMKIVVASKKFKSGTRSLGNGGWFQSTRPNY